MEQFHQDNYATINWTDKGSDIRKKDNGDLLQGLEVCWDFCKKQMNLCWISNLWSSTVVIFEPPIQVWRDGVYLFSFYKLFHVF